MWFNQILLNHLLRDHGCEHYWERFDYRFSSWWSWGRVLAEYSLKIACDCQSLHGRWLHLQLYSDIWSLREVQRLLDHLQPMKRPRFIRVQYFLHNCYRLSFLHHHLSFSLATNIYPLITTMMLFLVLSRYDSFIDVTSVQEDYLNDEVPFMHRLPKQ